MWLELLREECGVDPQMTTPLEQEADELMAILTTIIRRTEQKCPGSFSPIAHVLYLLPQAVSAWPVLSSISRLSHATLQSTGHAPVSTTGGSVFICSTRNVLPLFVYGLT